MKNFANIYKQLNSAQQEAVDVIDGPLLVLAGPGTGKTQLISARIAAILQKTDTLPQNILCLTFTESAALNMRTRLATMIGSSAYDVHISTYHSFGSDIIKSYPDYFRQINLETNEDSRLERPIDELAKTRIISEILSSLAYDDPLRSANYYVRSVVGSISEFKKACYTPSDLIHIAEENIKAIEESSESIQNTFGRLGRVPKFSQAIDVFTELQNCLIADQSSLTNLAINELDAAITSAQESKKTTALTKYKNKWLHKNEEGSWELEGRESSKKIISLAKVFERYQKILSVQSLYDFDDMIQRTISALKDNQELLFTLQETYQYILLDEFQDTNAAQFELVSLIASNPVNEGRPNVMAVGDDDQAIYAFQGADIGNMQAFLHAFSEVKIINLSQNYRSHNEILFAAKGISQQIENRLHEVVEVPVSKDLDATRYPEVDHASIERHDFMNIGAEYEWVTKKIKSLISGGVPLGQIAVLSPRHELLEKLVPYLNGRDITVSYEKRENVLSTPIIQMITQISRLLLALSEKNTALSNELLPVVLSFDFWELPVTKIWQVNWQLSTKSENRSWAEIALEHTELEKVIQFLLKLSLQISVTPLEYVFDYITGVSPIKIGSDLVYESPFKNYYFSENKRHKHQLEYYETLTYLSVIRAKLRDYQLAEQQLLTISDYLSFVNMYQEANQPLVNTLAITQAEDSVQLMTVYKAKGLEFEHVFLLTLHDDIWGKKARSSSNKLSLPANLQHVRYKGSSEDELKRLLYVAVTRAKFGLYLTSHAQSESGKSNEPVKYLQEEKTANGHISTLLPKHAQQVVKNSGNTFTSDKQSELIWFSKNSVLEPELSGLLKQRLQTYVMSPTHLNTYIDTEYGGPESFLLRTLLRFPQAPTPDGEFGSAIHATLEWYQQQILNKKKPNIKSVQEYFSTNLAGRYLTKNDLVYFDSRGKNALSLYTQSRTKMFANTAVLTEVDFAKESIVIGDDIRISGKIDRLEIDKQSKTVKVVDYKTGKPTVAWQNTTKHLKYRQQLFFYKLLIEQSRAYKGYTVESARLEFIEPNSQNSIVAPLYISFDDKEYKEFIKLLKAVWRRIQNLQFNDNSMYSADYKGALGFISKLLENID